MRLTEFWDSVNNYGEPLDMFTNIGSMEARLAFKSGMESQQGGTPKDKNPYNHGERAYAWLQGWKFSYRKQYGHQEDETVPFFPSTHPSGDAAAHG